jgi:flagellar motor component MotA
MYALRAYLVFIGLFVFSGSGVWQSKSSLITSLASLISLIFAYDIWRHFKKVKVAEVIFQEESINDEKIT